jgi:glutathione S-transferase
MRGRLGNMAGRPVLWHIAVSHYNEKARWALDYKGVEHGRRAPPPGMHMGIALWLTRGKAKTFPVLELDGEAYGDSTEIIEVLERRYPEPPLYPEDPEERRRALELEDYFDEEVAPHVRLLAWHEVIKDPEPFGRFAAEVLPPAMRGPGRRIAGRYGTWFLKARYGVANADSAELARSKVQAGFDQLETELGSGEYLVGDSFTVADLTAASILYPIVRPPEGPRVALDYPEPLERFRLSFSDRPGYKWIQEMFRRHRKRSPASARADVAAARS